jgi:hypothetical protein
LLDDLAPCAHAFDCFEPARLDERLHLACLKFDGSIDDGVDEGVFGAEVVQDAGVGQTETLRDGADGRPADAAGSEEFERDVDDVGGGDLWRPAGFRCCWRAFVGRSQDRSERSMNLADVRPQSYLVDTR